MSKEEATEWIALFQKKNQTARARLMEALLLHEALPMEEVTQKLHVQTPVIRFLEEKGLLSIKTIRTFRNPLDQMPKQQRQVVPNALQQGIADDIFRRWQNEDLRPSLLFGVTGSGKTEVYIALIEQMVRQGKQAIVLIPEIALTFQTVMRFYNHFGDRVSVLHSKMSAGERYDQYERAKNGELDVMIGPRSALFTPFCNLGVILIDEEHEKSYKNETVPCYHARETAIARANLCHGFVVLGSATPSLESYYRAQMGEYVLYEMPQRIGQTALPTVHVADMRKELRKGNRSILSESLHTLMENRLQKKEQILLFINRRGMAGFVSCRSCGEVIKCPHCDVSLHLHKNGRLICHYCGHTEAMVQKCKACGSPYIGAFRAGTQKIEEYIKKEFPSARVLRMDMDTTRQKDSYEKILSAFSNREADILIGTQMIVKGHDFSHVSLVGVLAADLSLHISDYRAGERTFQLLTQAAGRAGRAKIPGEVVIQTYQPEHYAIQTAVSQDYPAFYEQEMMFRKLLRYPPVWHMLLLQISSAEETLVNEAARMLQCKLVGNAKPASAASNAFVGNQKSVGASFIGNQKSVGASFIGNQKQSGGLSTNGGIKIGDMQVIGPADAAVSKVNDIYRKIIFVKAARYDRLVQIKNALDAWIKEQPVFAQVNVQFDFNPMGF